MHLILIKAILILVIVTTYGHDLEAFKCKDEIRRLSDQMTEVENTLQRTEKKLHLAEHQTLKRQTPVPPIAFFAVTSKNQVLGDYQTIIFDNVTTNEGFAYDKFDGQFTAPMSGLYFFSSSIMAFPGRYIHAEMVKNAVNMVYIFAAKGSVGLDDDTGTAVLNVVLQKGDKVWVRHRRDPGDTAYLESSYSTFSGFLIQEM